jgi:hypothetical protein
MANITYTFSTDVNPWSATGWVKATGAINGRVLGSAFTSTNSDSAIYVYDTQPTPVANKLITSIVVGDFANSSASRGGAIMTTTGDGISYLVRGYDLRCFKSTPGGGANTLTQIGSTVSITASANDEFTFEYNVVTGAIEIKQGGVSRFTATDTTHIFTAGVVDPVKVAALRLGVCSRDASGKIKSVTAYNLPEPQSITSINGGSPITVGQTGVP